MGVIENQVKTVNNFDYENEFKKLEKKIIKSLEEDQQTTTKSTDQTHELLFNVSRQIEDTHQVMISMSKDITALYDRQTSLEKCIANYGDIARSSSVILPDDEPTLNDGPITRSMSKRTRSTASRPKKVVKRAIPQLQELSYLGKKSTCIMPQRYEILKYNLFDTSFFSRVHSPLQINS